MDIKDLLPHEQIVVRARVLNPINSPEVASEWARNIIESLGMSVALGPYAYYCDTKGNAGLTCIAVLETSHIAIHIWNEVTPALVEFDLYTCSDLDHEFVLNTLHETFGLEEVQWFTVDRKETITIKGSYGVNFEN